MGAFFGFVFGLWFVVALFSSPYFWAKRVDRSHAPIVRRFMALAYALAWPYFVVTYFTNRSQKQAKQSNLDIRRSTILGNAATPTAPPSATSAPASPASASKIKDPFSKG
jgi:hypothetical protein